MVGLSGEHLGLLRSPTVWGDFEKGRADEIEHDEKHDNNGWFLDDLESVLQAGHNDCQLNNMNVSVRSETASACLDKVLTDGANLERRLTARFDTFLKITCSD